ncbi:MAG: phosphatidylcholine/phosphatidylserine synthase [Chloroflexi bacterium]|nr:phosphatidylcholine/phosphatidylserine synthase [Chloroflexota bacterium]
MTPESRDMPSLPQRVLPSLFTTANLLAGFIALVAAVEGRYALAAGAIFAGMAFDILDGQMARMVGLASTFGVEYDSLADVITFGVAPSLLAYISLLRPFGRYGWLGGFLFVVAAALRLARFNAQTLRAEAEDEPPLPYFEGLPTPAAAGTVAGLVLFAVTRPHPPQVMAWIVLFAMYILAALKVSRVPYGHMKHVDLRSYGLMRLIAAFAALLAFIIAVPTIALPVLFVGYTLSGPIRLGFQKLRQLTRRSLER